MTSLLIAVCVPALLLVSGANFSQATDAATSDILEGLTILGGSFANDQQVKGELEHYGTTKNDIIPFEYLPVDIPALNEYYPLLFKEDDSDFLHRLCIVLSVPGEDGELLSAFYNITDRARFLSGDLTVAELTREDLADQPYCTGVITRLGDVVVHLVKCATDDQGHGASYGLNHRCDEAVVVFGKGTPEHDNGIPYNAIKIQQGVIPPSWLEGVDGYVNPCDA